MRNLLTALFLMLLLSACGKKGPLIYPELLVPAAPAAVSLHQSGTSLKLSFVLPSKDRAGRNLSNLAGVSILKRDLPADQQPVCNSCRDDYVLFKKLNLDLLPAGVQRNGSLLLLLDGDVHPERNYSYIVTSFTREGLAGAPSVPVATVVVPPPVPPVLQAISQPTEINLEFVGLPPGEGTLVGYNLYRTSKGEPFSYQPLRERVTSTHYTDMGLERKTTYVYAVRSVVLLPAGIFVESGLSNEAEGQLKDDE
jgi:predicted small lipoprotein YifL